MTVRGHQPFVIETFNGLWDRGDDESCPSDHLTVADNVQYFESGVETRNPLNQWQNSGVNLSGILRIYNYVMQNGQSLLVMNQGGKIYHITKPNAIPFLIATFPEATDFGFVAIAGRAYITPFKTYVDNSGQTYELGLKDEYVHVYSGDGLTPARRAAGPPPTNGDLKPLLAYNSTIEGITTEGIHSIAVTYNGGLPGPNTTPALSVEVFRIVNSPGKNQIKLTGIPIGPAGVTSRNIQMTLAIPPEKFNPDPLIYTYYTILNINDNTTTEVLLNISDESILANPAIWPPYTPGVFPPPMTDALLVVQLTKSGFADLGFHLIGVVYETDTGYLTAPGPRFFGGQTYVSTTRTIKVYNIPVSPDAHVKKRHLVSTKEIVNYNGDQNGYQYFFIPGGVIDNNTDTSKEINYYDSDLVSDASHLVDNFTQIPAGVNLNTYHSRLVVVGETGTVESLRAGEIRGRRRTRVVTAQTDNRSIARVSAPGEPEAISKVEGLIVTPPDGTPLTNCQEFRDILYLFKKTRTYAYSDNFDEPSTWAEEVLDQGVGAPVHGIASVLDSGGVNTDFLLITDWSGLMLFNGTYTRPEMTFKIEDFWASLVRNSFHYIQIANDSIGKKIYITLPPLFQNIVLYADYSNGMDAKNIKWAKWIFDAKISSVCLIEANKVIFGAEQ